MWLAWCDCREVERQLACIAHNQDAELDQGNRRANISALGQTACRVEQAARFVHRDSGLTHWRLRSRDLRYGILIFTDRSSSSSTEEFSEQTACRGTLVPGRGLRRVMAPSWAGFQLCGSGMRHRRLEELRVVCHIPTTISQRDMEIDGAIGTGAAFNS